MKKPRYSDENFFARLKKGHQTECEIANTIRSWGFNCPDPVLQIRDTYADAVQFTKHQTDLIVHGYLNIEVKSRNVSFNSPDDFPFEDLILEGEHTYKTKENRPDMYIVHSMQTGAIMAADPVDDSTWVPKKAYDRDRNITNTSYCVPKEYLKPEEYLREYLKSMQI